MVTEIEELDRRVLVKQPGALPTVLHSALKERERHLASTVLDIVQQWVINIEGIGDDEKMWRPPRLTVLIVRRGQHTGYVGNARRKALVRVVSCGDDERIAKIGLIHGEALRSQ